MAKKEKYIGFRATKELETKLKAVQDMKGYSTITQTVKHLIQTGLTFYEVRKQKIKELKKEIEKYNIEKWELNK